KVYIYGIIVAGTIVLSASLTKSPPSIQPSFIVYVALAALASAVKLRLPGMDGNFSLNFLFLLFGIAHFTLPETLLAGCAGGVAQSLCNTKKRPTALQALFNSANFI